MPLQHFGRAPYAPTGAIVAVIEKHRNVRLTKIDDAVLDARVGVSEALRPRVLASLELLEFIDADGNPTAEFARLPNLSDADFKPALAEMLTKAYAPIIEDLKGDDLGNADQVEASFRSFTPTGQIKRMVNLYLGLMTYADVINEGPRTRGAKPSAAPRTRQDGTPPKKPLETEQKPPLRTPPPTEDPSYSRSVSLDGGAGSITLTGTVNVFGLKGKSRDFVFALIDLMDDYEILSADGQGGDHA